MIDVNSTTISINFSRWLALRGLNPNKVGTQTGGKITAKTVANIKEGKVKTVQLRTLVAIATALNESPTELIGICIGEILDPLDITHNSVAETDIDALIAPGETAEAEMADIRNSQLLIQLLRSINEQQVGLRSDFSVQKDDLQRIEKKVEMGIRDKARLQVVKKVN